MCIMQLVKLQKMHNSCTSSKMEGSAFSSVEYAKDTPVRLVKGVLVDDMES